jgi:hypothetical protein
MRKEIDQLSKNLAEGMSRRKALWRFISSIGAAGAAGALGTRTARASSGITYECQQLCDTQSQEILTLCRNLEGNSIEREAYCSEIASQFYTDCLQATSVCRSGSCAEFVGFSGRTITAAAFTSFVGGDHDFTCVPSGEILA